eukprot:8528653-Ditylum_brightwellii.AAC.1
MGLMEYLSTQHQQLPETNLWFRSKHEIAGVWCSPELTAENSMLLPFGFGIGDHRLILINIPTKQLIGHNIPTIKRPKARHLQCLNPK